MAKAGADRYNPESFARNDVSEGLGLVSGRGEKHPTPTLRVFSPQGNFWLMYAKFAGADESEDGTCIEVFCSGIVNMPDPQGEVKPTFSHYILKIEGERLSTIADKLARQVKHTLRIEDKMKETEENKYKISVITITSYTPVVSDGIIGD